MRLQKEKNNGMVETVISAIPQGAENAIHLKELSDKLRLNDGTVKRYIKLARQQGYKLISDAKGYWISESTEEWRKWRNMMRKQALSRLEVIKPMNDSLKAFDGQIDLTVTYKGGKRE